MGQPFSFLWDKFERCGIIVGPETPAVEKHRLRESIAVHPGQQCVTESSSDVASGLHDRLWGSAGVTGETPTLVTSAVFRKRHSSRAPSSRSVTQKRVASLQRHQLRVPVEAQTEWRGREPNWGALGSRPTRGSTVWSPCAVMSLRGGKLQTGSVFTCALVWNWKLPELPVRIQFSLIQSYRVNCNQTIRMERKKVIDNHLPWCFVGVTRTYICIIIPIPSPETTKVHPLLLEKENHKNSETVPLWCHNKSNHFSHKVRAK